MKKRPVSIVIAVILVVWSHLCESVIEPRLSEGWAIAASLVGSLFVIKCGFRLTFFRSLLVSVIYWLVIALAVYVILEQPDEADARGAVLDFQFPPPRSHSFNQVLHPPVVADLPGSP